MTGGRIGELLGLAWDDVDWKRSSIAIRRGLVAKPGVEPEFETPKTSRGRRVISLGAVGVEALRAQRVRQNADRLRLGGAYTDFGLVIASKVGTHLSERNVIRAFKSWLKRAEVRDDVRVHDLRHYHITTAAHSGVSVKALSTRVGHASVAFTLDRYAHHFDASDQAVADAVERSIAPPSVPQEDVSGRHPKV